jgi:hypothetical protein
MTFLSKNDEEKISPTETKAVTQRSNSKGPSDPPEQPFSSQEFIQPANNGLFERSSPSDSSKMKSTLATFPEEHHLHSNSSDEGNKEPFKETKHLSVDDDDLLVRAARTKSPETDSIYEIRELESVPAAKGPLDGNNSEQGKKEMSEKLSRAVLPVLSLSPSGNISLLQNQNHHHKPSSHSRSKSKVNQ